MKYRNLIILTLLALLLVSLAPLAAQDTTDCETGFYLYEHVFGETCISENPERIVAVGPDATESLLALDIVPVGVAIWSGIINESQVPDYLLDRYQRGEIAFIGTEFAPDLEGMLALAPDLIIVRESQAEAYPLLSEIAPTVAITGYIRDEERVTWKEFLTEVGFVTGREEQAQQLLSEYTERAEVLQSLLSVPPPTVSLVRFDPGRVRLYLTTSFPGGIIQDVGIARPEAQDQPGFVQQISLETIRQADADIMLIAQGDTQNRLFEQYTSSPLWQTLNAVQNDAVFEVDHAIWIVGSSVISAHRILDDLFRIVAGVDPQEVSPNPFLVNEDDETDMEATEEASD